MAHSDNDLLASRASLPTCEVAIREALDACVGVYACRRGYTCAGADISWLVSTFGIFALGIFVGFVLAPPLEIFIAFKRWAWSLCQDPLRRQRYLGGIDMSHIVQSIKISRTGFSISRPSIRMFQQPFVGVLRWPWVLAVRTIRNVGESIRFCSHRLPLLRRVPARNLKPTAEAVAPETSAEFPSESLGVPLSEAVTPVKPSLELPPPRRSWPPSKSCTSRSSACSPFEFDETVIPDPKRTGHKRVRSSPQDGAYGGSPVVSLQSLTPQRGPLLDEFLSPQKVQPAFAFPFIEGFFVAVSSPGNVPKSEYCWPFNLSGSRLEKTIVTDGWCTDPARSILETGIGGGDGRFVLCLLETTLSPKGDPSGLLYVCVHTAASGLVRSASAPPATDHVYEAACDAMANSCSSLVPFFAGPSSTDVKHNAAEVTSTVVCIVSKIPLFSFLFKVLEILKENLDDAGRLLDRINASALGQRLMFDGIDLTELRCGENFINLRLPRPICCEWEELKDGPDVVPFGPISRTFAHWQAAWGLEALLERWENLVGDTLAKLLACILLERTVLLLGDVPCVSTMALVLRGLVWPFRWLHPFLSAPPPSALLNIPFLESPTPLLVSLAQLPPQWSFRTIDDLPPQVAAGVLGEDYVRVALAHDQSSGTKGGSVELPAGKHKAFLKHVVKAKQKLRKKEVDLQKAAEIIHDALEAEVTTIAMLIKRYAEQQVESMCVANSETAGAVDVVAMSASHETVQRCCREAADRDAFMRWVAAELPEELAPDRPGSEDAVHFYETFFGTQMCHDFLHREIISQMTTAGA